jgi:hypothetical protein
VTNKIANTKLGANAPEGPRALETTETPTVIYPMHADFSHLPPSKKNIREQQGILNFA